MKIQNKPAFGAYVITKGSYKDFEAFNALIKSAKRNGLTGYRQMKTLEIEHMDLIEAGCVKPETFNSEKCQIIATDQDISLLEQKEKLLKSLGKPYKNKLVELTYKSAVNIVKAFRMLTEK